MTASEVGWLLTGAQLGVMLCVIALAVSTTRQNCRTKAYAEATATRALKYRATDGWRGILVGGETP
ncbi:hypothetical protein [Streptomyces sp. NBC_00354]|uniref:hypothetical protein n=1 Tax=Streptomyces sp. NBC_00354 TaxID=2975723 RepID=UPI002E26EA46